jgi:acyl carrier protein
MKTLDGLRDVLVKDFELPRERLHADTRLEDIELDSLALTELIFSLEELFDVTAASPDRSFATLGDVAAYIDRLIAERDAARPERSATDGRGA